MNFIAARRNEEVVQKALRQWGRIKPSLFLRALGMTGGCYLCFGHNPKFPLEEMDKPNTSLSPYSEDPVGFEHPDFIPLPGKIHWIEPRFILPDLTILIPWRFDGGAMFGSTITADKYKHVRSEAELRSILNVRPRVDSLPKMTFKDLLKNGCHLLLDDHSSEAGPQTELRIQGRVLLLNQ